MRNDGQDQPDASSQLARQFALEKELARRLLTAPKSERRGLYTAVYDELFREFPHLTGPRDRSAELALKLQVLRPLLKPGAVFLEIGAGDLALASAVAEAGLSAIAIDASNEILAGETSHPRLTVLVADGPPYEVPDESVQLAFSCHFIEHIHPEDLQEHLSEVLRVLAPGGAYICITPSRLLGPHDVSRYFAEEACGLHLREYTHASLGRAMRGAGFRRLRMLAGSGTRQLKVPVGFVAFMEMLAGILPRGLRRWILSRSYLGAGPEPLRLLEQVKLIGLKSPQSHSRAARPALRFSR